MEEIPITAETIQEAYDLRVKPHIHRTPILECSQINQRAGQRRLFLKAEHLQKAGSFKIRGAMNAISLSNATQIVTDSSGNHAQAVALACQLLNKKAIIIMPSNSPQVKVSAVKETYKGEVILCNPTQEGREKAS